MKADFKKLASQTIIYGLSTIVGRVINFLFVPLYTRVFTTGEYGTVTKLYSYSSFLLVIFLFGLETAFFRYAKKQEEIGKTYASTVVPIGIISLAIIGLGILNANALAALIHEESVLSIQLMLGIIWLDIVSSLPFAKLRLENKALRFASIKLINIGLTVALNMFFLVYAKSVYDSSDTGFYSPEMGVNYIFIANGIASLVSVLLLLDQLFSIKLSAVDFFLFRKLFRYGWPVMVLGIAGIINETLDRILLDYLLPGSDVERRGQIGIYGACYKLAIFISLIIQAYRYAAEPFFFSKSDDKDAKQMYAILMNYFVIVVLVALLVILLFQDYFNLFIGKEFREGVHIVPILIYANLFLGIYYNLSVWYKLTDKTLLGAYVSVGGALITIVANVILIPIYGYLGSAIATLICYVSLVLVAYLMGRKYYAIPYDVAKIVGYISLSLVIYFVFKSVQIEGELLAFFTKSMALAFFLAVVFLFEMKGLLKR